MPCGQAASPAIPAHKSAIVLFDGSDLKNFDTFLTSKGLNSDPEHVFQVENGVIHVSGKEFGYIITKKTYQNFYLRAEFKWGEGTYGSREGKARDSGILYNVQGVQKVFSPFVFADGWPQGKAETRLVLIGKGLDKAWISARFATCVAPEQPVFDRAMGAI